MGFRVVLGQLEVAAGQSRTFAPSSPPHDAIESGQPFPATTVAVSSPQHGNLLRGMKFAADAGYGY